MLLIHLRMRDYLYIPGAASTKKEGAKAVIALAPLSLFVLFVLEDFLESNLTHMPQLVVNIVAATGSHKPGNHLTDHTGVSDSEYTQRIHVEGNSTCNRLCDTRQIRHLNAEFVTDTLQPVQKGLENFHHRLDQESKNNHHHYHVHTCHPPVS